MIAAAEAALPGPSSRPTDTYNTGRVRLPEYRAWRIRGSRVQSLRFEDDDSPMPISMFVELTAFREWLAEQDGDEPAERPNAQDLIKATGLRGVEKLLRMVGMFPSGSGNPTSGSNGG